MKKMISLHGADDKKVYGKWIRSWSEDVGDVHLVHRCHAACLWDSINRRCGADRQIRDDIPTYKNCKNGFDDYQHFAEWCQGEYGYGLRDSDSYFWPIDKDLLEYGNKVYSGRTCIFVPRYINSLLIDRKAARGEYPIGVSYKKKSSDMLNELKKPYYAQICRNGKSKSLGSFYTPFDAHVAWQRVKVDFVKGLITGGEFSKHTKLIYALERNIERLSDDLLNNRETK